MFFCKIKEGESYIFDQGARACCFFVIKEGEVIVEIDKVDKCVLNKGNGFGELALISNSTRTAAIKSQEPERVRMFGLKRGCFKKVMESFLVKNFTTNIKLIDSIAIFSKKKF